MKSQLLLLLMCLAVVSCKRKAKYYNNGQWSLPQSQYNVLKNNPVEVNETYFIDPEDTIPGEKTNPVTYTIWKFNKNGDVILEKDWKNNGHFFIIEANYDYKGMQASYYSCVDEKGEKDYDGFIHSSIKGGQFVKVYDFGKIKNVALESFSSSGDSVRIDFVEDSNHLDKIKSTSHFFYKKNKLQQTIYQDKEDKVITSYFYSNKNYLDSIITVKNGKKSKEAFLNNEHGDPLIYASINSSGDTLQVERMRYEYDEFGNWIKRFKSRENIDKSMGNVGPVHPDYSLITRQIKY